MATPDAIPRPSKKAGSAVELRLLCELCLPYVKVGGAFIALKGPAVTEELKEADRAIALLGGTVEQVCDYAVPGEELHHNIVIIRKSAPTPKNSFQLVQLEQLCQPP